MNVDEARARLASIDAGIADLQRWQIDEQRSELNRLADWLAERPADERSYVLDIGRQLGIAVVRHIEACNAAGVAFP